MTGAGEAIPGGVPGDLYVKLHVKADETFKKEGFNLKTTLKVKLTDALLGADYSVKTLDGTIKVKIPAGASPSEILRVKGKGVPVNFAIWVLSPSSAKKIVEQLKNEGV